MLEFLLFFSSIYVTVKHNIFKIVGYIGIIVFVLNVNFRNSKLLKYVLYLLLKAHITKHNGVAQCTEKRTVELEKIKIAILETTYTKKDKMRACVRGFLCVRVKNSFHYTLKQFINKFSDLQKIFLTQKECIPFTECKLMDRRLDIVEDRNKRIPRLPTRSKLKEVIPHVAYEFPN